jgi:hypothetical protein
MKPIRWLALWVAISAMYVLTSSGRIASTDGLSMYAVTRSILADGTFSTDPCTPEVRGNDCVPGVEGRNYAGYGLAPSIISVPAYAAGGFIAETMHRDARFMTGLSMVLWHGVVSALVSVVFAVWLFEIGISWTASAFAALVVAFASPLWYHATKTFCSEPSFTLGLLGCCYLLARGDRPALLLGAGACLGFAFTCRVYGMVLGPAILGYALLNWKSMGAPAKRLITNLLWFGGPVSVFVLFIVWSNVHRFGSIFKTGYHLQFRSVGELFSNPLLGGMVDLLFDGEVGLLVFVPWVVALPFLWRFFRAGHKKEAILVLSIAVTNYIFFAKYKAWRGGLSYGPRLLVPTIPFLAFPLAVLFDQKKEIRKTARWRFTTALIACALMIGVVTAPYPFARYYNLRREAREHGRGNEWWIRRPVLKAFVEFPKWFCPPSDNATDVRDRQYLMSFPNGINLVKPDFWILKASLLGISNGLLGVVAIGLLCAFGWGMWKVYLPIEAFKVTRPVSERFLASS